MSWFSDIWRQGLTAKQRTESRSAERYSGDLAAFEQSLTAMTLAEAQGRAEQILAHSSRIETRQWSGPPLEFPQLAPRLASVLRRYCRIEGHDAYVDATEIEPMSQNATLVRVGGEAGWHVDLAVRPGEEPIYALSNDAPLHDALDLALPSIDHWILWLERSEELLSL